jgi:hypothetical protein
VYYADILDRFLLKKIASKFLLIDIFCGGAKRLKLLIDILPFGWKGGEIEIKSKKILGCL